jgi:hypothetical protein
MSKVSLPSGYTASFVELAICDQSVEKEGINHNLNAIDAIF